MVATRRGTREEPQKEGKTTPEEIIPPDSPVHTRRSVKKDVQTSGNCTDKGESIVIGRSPLKSDPVKHSTQMITRHRHRSEQTDTDVSESESTASNTSTRITRSRQILGQLTDSARKLRSSRSVLITDPIIESNEDAPLSEAESVCSSVSTSARRKQPGTPLRSVSTRNRKSIVLSEPAKDVSGEESKSSVSPVKSVVTRNRRSSRNQTQKEETSDAESCASGISLQPLARRFSRRNKPNVQTEEAEMISETNENDDEKNLEKLSPKTHDVKSDDTPSVKENILSSPHRESQNRPEAQEHEVILISDDESIENLDVDEPNEKENVMTEVDLAVETSGKSSLQFSETQQVENIPDLQLQGESTEEEHTVEKSHVIDKNTTEETNENLPGEQEDQNMSEDIKLCLSIDSSESDKSEHGDNEVDKKEDENHMEVEEEDSEQVVEKGKSKKASGQNVEEDGLFVIDTAPGSSKKYFLEDDDDDDDFIDKAEEEDENNIEVDEEDNDHVVEKQKSKKAFEKKLQHVETDGLFVIDTTPGMDSSKKYFVEHDDHVSDKEDELEAGEKGEIAGQEDEEEEEEFIDKDEDEDEEETLLNRPRSGFSLSTSIDTGISLKNMGGLYINFNAEKINPGPSLLSKMKNENKKKDELLKKSVITPDFEKKESVPPYRESNHKLKKLRKEERDKTTGREWFDMKAPDMTEELKNDLKALKMRSAMDPKHFYKKNDREGFPKYFQVATVVDNPVDFYHSRIPKKERKRTIVEELIADSEFRRYNKKKFTEIMAEKAARAEGKKNRKKKKFRT